MPNLRNNVVNTEKFPANDLPKQSAYTDLDRDLYSLRSEIKALQIQVADLKGAHEVARENIANLQQQLRQLEQQQEQNRIEEAKRQIGRDRLIADKLREDFMSSVRAAVEEILPQRRRDRSHIPEPAAQPKNPSMPVPMHLGRVEKAASAVPRLVLYGLLMIVSCLAVVFAINPEALYALLEPTQTTVIILLVMFILSVVVILFTHSES